MGPYDRDVYRRHKEKCTKGCSRPSAQVQALDLAALGIQQVDDDQYVYSLCSKTIDEDDVKSNSTEPKNKHDLNEVSSMRKPTVIQIEKELCNKFTFKMHCLEINVKLPVLIDSGAALNVVSTALIEKYHLPRFNGSSHRIKFGNGQTSPISQYTTLTLSQNGYVQKIEFWIADIHLPLILGVPWISAVTITKIEWKSGLFEFYDGQLMHQLIPEAFEKVSKIDSIDCISWEEFSSAVDSGEFEEWGFLTDISITGDDLPVNIIEETNSSSALNAFLSEYSDVFDKPEIPPPSRPEDHQINLIPSSQIPAARGIGRLSEEKLSILKSTIDDLLHKNFIRPSTSPFGASVLFATKPDGTYRMCVDYRGLNAITIKDKSPLPNLSELRDRVKGATLFSSMDLRDGFYNILVKEADRHKTAFRTRYGHYEFNVLPMGLTNSPATMQSTMNRIFGKYLDIWLLIYLDLFS